MDYEDAHNGRGLSGAHGPNPARSIIGAEDEDFENDLHQTVDDQSSHFNSIELLKTRPTHLLVFLHHVILQFDCAPLLCYLHADLLKNLSAKDTKKAFMEFYNNFLDKGAILRVPVPQNVSNELDRNRPDLTSEEMQRRFAQDVQNVQATEVLRQLDDFRKKRMMGMTPNEVELAEVENHYQTDRVPREMKEKAVAERLLEKLFESNPSIVADEEKGSTIFTAVAVYMKHLGVKTRVADSKKSRGFFKRKAPKKEEVKGGIRGILVEAGRYLPSVRSNDIKRLDTEGDKNNHERKASGSIPAHSGPSSEGSTAPSLGRKPGLPVLGILQSMEVADVPLSSTVTSSPDTSHTESGQSSIPSDHRSVSEGGDASPGIGVPVCDLTVTIDTPVEETNEKDRRKTRSVRRSESLCVDRRHSRRTSGRAKQSRSRSDVDLQAAASSHPPSPSPHHSL